MGESGALRERFEAWLREREPLVSLKRTSKAGAYDSNWVNTSWLAWKAALSLSSPIEPVCGDCDTAAKCHGLGDCPAQASSEIREALEARIVNLKANLEHWRDINARLKRGETVNVLSSNESYHGDEISFLEKILGALAPSRQGAGGE